MINEFYKLMKSFYININIIFQMEKMEREIIYYIKKIVIHHEKIYGINKCKSYNKGIIIRLLKKIGIFVDIDVVNENSIVFYKEKNNNETFFYDFEKLDKISNKLIEKIQDKIDQNKLAIKIMEKTLELD